MHDIAATHPQSVPNLKLLVPWPVALLGSDR